MKSFSCLPQFLLATFNMLLSLTAYNSNSNQLLRTAYKSKIYRSVSVGIEVADEQNIGKGMSMLGLTVML